jgi:hypothetical protein
MPPKKSLTVFARLIKSRRSLARVKPVETTLPPPFLTLKLRRSVERLLPPGHHRRLRLYFETYGCLRCARTKMIYGANGFCICCLRMIEKRLKKIDTKIQASVQAPRPGLEEIYLRPYKAARELLADLVPKIARKSSQNKPESKSPPQTYFRCLD